MIPVWSIFHAHQKTSDQKYLQTLFSTKIIIIKKTSMVQVGIFSATSVQTPKQFCFFSTI